MPLFNDGKDAPKESTTASHMPVLRALLGHLKIECVLEFGCGIYSTREFLLEVPRVYTIEPLHREWLVHVQEHLGGIYSAKVAEGYGRRRWYRNFVEGRNVLLEARELAAMDKPELVFVDSGDRAPLVVESFTLASSAVVLHDSQKGIYQGIVAPKFWREYVFKRFPVHYRMPDGGDLDDRPWTTVWALGGTHLDVAALLALEDEESGKLYEKHSWPYFDRVIPSLGEVK
jgi:hypothetical protein